MDVFSLRLTSRHTLDVISSYDNAIVPFVVSNTSLRAKRVLQAAPDQPLDFAWLKSLIPKSLAAVILDRYILTSNYSGWTRCIRQRASIKVRDQFIGGFRRPYDSQFTGPLEAFAKWYREQIQYRIYDLEPDTWMEYVPYLVNLQDDTYSKYPQHVRFGVGNPVA